jgi:hypothetical protein
MPEPALHKVWRHIRLERAHAEAMPQAFWHRRRPDDRRHRHDRFYIPPGGRRLQFQSRMVESCGSRCAIRSLNARLSPRSKSGGSGTCLTTPRLRRFRVWMQATPLSMSIAAGVNASTSEMRAPLQRRVRQKRRIGDGMRWAASTKRRRSAALRYFRLPDGPNRF